MNEHNRIELFYEYYESKWDYASKNLEKGFLYIQFLMKKNILTNKEHWQIDFSKISCEFVEEYKTYIKKYMINHLGYSKENFESEFTLESVMEEFKNGMY